jgi:hypothetical protein
MSAPQPRKRKRSGGLLGKISGQFTNAGKIGGSIDPSTRLIDPKDAMLLGNVSVAEMGMERDGGGELVIAIELRGKINTTGKEVNPLVLASPDGAALLVAQIIGLVRNGRTGPEFDHALAARMEEAID